MRDCMNEQTAARAGAAAASYSARPTSSEANTIAQYAQLGGSRTSSEEAHMQRLRRLAQPNNFTSNDPTLADGAGGHGPFGSSGSPLAYAESASSRRRNDMSVNQSSIRGGSGNARSEISTMVDDINHNTVLRSDNNAAISAGASAHQAEAARYVCSFILTNFILSNLSQDQCG